MKKKRILIILIILVFLIFGFGITYSLFTSSTNMSANQNIAKFIFDAKTLDELHFELVDLTPGATKEYPFSISNNNSGNLSNVSIKYQMTIKTYHFVPLIIKLYYIDSEEENLIMTCDETYTRNTENELICNTQILEMDYSSEKLDNYKLKVQFDEEYDSDLYSNLVDYINIEIKSWQKTENR